MQKLIDKYPIMLTTTIGFIFVFFMHLFWYADAFFGLAYPNGIEEYLSSVFACLIVFAEVYIVLFGIEALGWKLLKSLIRIFPFTVLFCFFLGRYEVMNSNFIFGFEVAGGDEIFMYFATWTSIQVLTAMCLIMMTLLGKWMFKPIEENRGTDTDAVDES